MTDEKTIRDRGEWESHVRLKRWLHAQPTKNVAVDEPGPEKDRTGDADR